MAKKDTTQKRPQRPALSPEARESQLVSLAVDLAEQQLRDGTASSQVITHYLKLGSMREKIERDLIKKQMELMDAKKQNLKSTDEIKKLYTEAITALGIYGGKDSEKD